MAGVGKKKQIWNPPLMCLHFKRVYEEHTCACVCVCVCGYKTIWYLYKQIKKVITTNQCKTRVKQIHIMAFGSAKRNEKKILNSIILEIVSQQNEPTSSQCHKMRIDGCFLSLICESKKIKVLIFPKHMSRVYYWIPSSSSINAMPHLCCRNMRWTNEWLKYTPSSSLNSFYVVI